jgi:hypothetical protein
MAISLGFGVLFSTVIILLMVPAFYLIVEDLKTIILEAVGDCGRIFGKVGRLLKSGVK